MQEAAYQQYPEPFQEKFCLQRDHMHLRDHQQPWNSVELDQKIGQRFLSAGTSLWSNCFMIL